MSLDAEAKLLRLAAAQHQAFTGRQAIELGVSKKVLLRRVACGSVVRLHRGVYAFVQGEPTWQTCVIAACLACGSSAVASHGSAAAIWTLAEGVEVPEVTIMGSQRRDHERLVVYRTDHVEVARRGGFRVTPPMRTLLDLASIYTDERLGRAVDDLHRRRFVDIERTATYLDLPRNRSKRGVRVLREIVALRDPSHPIESALESMFFGLLKRYRLPLPEPQVEVRTRRGIRRIDFAYPDHRLAIELDGFGEHGGRAAFESDRLRQNELEELGWHVRRFTWIQLTQQPHDVAYTVGIALGLEPVRWVHRGRLQSGFGGVA